ncbi:MAG: DUF1223 domain-containing protein [Alphaproteobacteria bacterium]|nr:DUF1223 domain-containing protein [Alphaproteobacteria bacterium]
MMTRLASLAFGVIALAGLAAGAMAADPAGHSPIVVELYTSQGCSSCPPAEAFLSELANRDDVIALEFHVDYWDYIGWKDSFAKPEFTSRQKKYVETLKGRYAYTPQMVIHGKAHVVGSHRDEVESFIQQYAADNTKGPSISVKRNGDKLIVAVGPGAGKAGYDVVLAIFDKPHVTEIRSGENSGRTAKNSNVVREIVPLGSWSGKAAKFDVSLAGKEGDGGCAVLVQAHDQGPILAAAALPFDY